ncbi:C25 family cysteine peptidase, partial [Acinetobacter baumannii]
DDPTKKSLGESLLYNNENGAVGLLTTTRLVFSASNTVLNNFFVEQLFTKQNGQFVSLGEAVRLAKNKTIVQSGDVLNSRKFALLGDP